MKKLTVCSALLFGLGACSGGGMTAETARKQVDQLVALYNQDRPKFVIQKQTIEQAEDCERATSLRKAVEAMEAEANMTPGDSETITMVRMELVQAEKTCLSK